MGTHGELTGNIEEHTRTEGTVGNNEERKGTGVLKSVRGEDEPVTGSESD